MLASGSGDKTVRLWDMNTGQSTLTLIAEDGITSVAFSPNAKYIAAGSLDMSVYVWDPHQGNLLERLGGPNGHKDSVYSVNWSPNGKNLVSGSLDKTIKMWELSNLGMVPSPVPKDSGYVSTFKGHSVGFISSLPLKPVS